jgi:hypothetical protein
MAGEEVSIYTSSAKKRLRRGRRDGKRRKGGKGRKKREEKPTQKGSEWYLVGRTGHSSAAPSISPIAKTYKVINKDR